MANTIENVIRAVSGALKAAVHPNVDISTHTEYTEIAQLPAIVLFYPSLEDYRPNEMNERRIFKNADGVTTTIKPPVIFKNFVFDFEIYASKMIGAEGLTTLQEKFILWLERTGTITVDGKEYELHGEEPQSPQWSPNISNLKRIVGTFTVEGVEIDGSDAETGHVVLDRIYDTEQKG